MSTEKANIQARFEENKSLTVLNLSKALNEYHKIVVREEKQKRGVAPVNQMYCINQRDIGDNIVRVQELLVKKIREMEAEVGINRHGL